MLTLTVEKFRRTLGASRKAQMSADETTTSKSLNRLREADVTACFSLQPLNMQRRSDAAMTSAKSEHLIRQPTHSKEMKDLLEKIVNDSRDKLSKSNSLTGFVSCPRHLCHHITSCTHHPHSLKKGFTWVFKQDLCVFRTGRTVQCLLQEAETATPPQATAGFPGGFYLDSMTYNVFDLLVMSLWLGHPLQEKTSPPSTARANPHLLKWPARCRVLQTALLGPGPPGPRVPTAVPPRPRRADRAVPGSCWRCRAKVGWHLDLFVSFCCTHTHVLYPLITATYH